MINGNYNTYTYKYTSTYLFFYYIRYFNCGRWLAKDEDDKQIERELSASKEGVEVAPLIPYEVKVVTGKFLFS